MKKELRPHLIQRAEFQNRSEKSGIDSILKFDYMGSAEFEWGALPKSLERIRNENQNYTFLDIPIEDKVISVFCLNEQKAEIQTYLKSLVDKTTRTKEFTGFDSYIKNDGYFAERFDFWWDITNDLMFWKKNTSFELDFKNKIFSK